MPYGRPRIADIGPLRGMPISLWTLDSRALRHQTYCPAQTVLLAPNDRGFPNINQGFARAFGSHDPSRQPEPYRTSHLQPLVLAFVLLQARLFTTSTV
ncbi:hypothetical protein J6590_021007 [Homalodisca vitripennis]|nr:hypothetical protein J6590_021007 [Homalodisca vitripennis]